MVVTAEMHFLILIYVNVLSSIAGDHMLIQLLQV